MKNLYLIFLMAALMMPFSVSVQAKGDQSDVIKNYTNLVYANYKDAYEDGVKLQKSIDQFLNKPTEKNLEKAKKAWLVSRDSYGQSEAFRFYEGPIDYVDADGNEGPEGRLNAWPLDEAYIDYVQRNLEAGIVNDDKDIAITRALLTDKNQADDEADVSTGYHAIEFLLWGQDFSLETPGTRPVSDYAITAENERRRTYLDVVTALLVSDLKFLMDEWAPSDDNFAKTFIADEKALSKIMTALATLSGFELASERMATALDSGDQEDEHSCFSDNTHNDFIYNAKGIKNVYWGRYGDVKGANIHDMLAAKSPELADKIKSQLNETETLIAAIPQPIDREVLSTPEGSAARMKMEAAITSLQKQADLFKEAGKALNIEVSINE